MANTNAVGPEPFADAGGVDSVEDPLPEEYTVAVPAHPSNPKLLLRCYQGTWVLEPRVPGIMAIQRAFAPRPGDVVLVSPPKCGTTWLKALAFATMARGAYPPAHPDHPLLRLNPHDCVPFMEMLFAKGLGRKIEALPSPRLMATHMHHSHYKNDLLY
jgi:hydroxyjasmonate sulfotransferase